MSIKTIYTKEGRIAADKILSKPISLLSIDGRNTRTIGTEGVQSLYNLTVAKNGVKASKENKNLSKELKKFFTKDEYTLSEIVDLIDPYPVDEVVQWKGKFTTLGRVIFNEVVFAGIKNHAFINETIDSKNLSKIMNNYAGKLVAHEISVDDYKKILNRHHDLAFGIAEIVCASLSRHMLIDHDEVFESKRNELLQKYKSGIEKNDIAAMQAFEDELIAFSKEYYKNDPMIDLYNSGAGGSWKTNFKSLKVSLGAIPDPGVGTTLVTRSLKEGLDNKDIMPAANLQRFGAFMRAQATADGGYIVKRMNAAFQSVIGIQGDCGSKLYLDTIDYDRNDLLYRYIKVSGKEILVTPDIVDKYVGKPVQKRSPMFCKQKGAYCSHCMGELSFILKEQGVVNIGLDVSNVGSTILNAFMKATHDMGAKIFKIDDFDNFIEK